MAAAERVRQRQRHLRDARVDGAPVAPAPCLEHARHAPRPGRREQQPRQRAGDRRAEQERPECAGEQQPPPLGGAGCTTLTAEPDQHVG